MGFKLESGWSVAVVVRFFVVRFLNLRIVEVEDKRKKNGGIVSNVG